jgi:hypothetical protein
MHRFASRHVIPFSMVAVIQSHARKEKQEQKKHLFVTVDPPSVVQSDGKFCLIISSLPIWDPELLLLFRSN